MNYNHSLYFKFRSSLLVRCGFVLLLCFSIQVLVDAQVSGKVFHDFNADGVQTSAAPAPIEPGFSNILVNAYDATGSLFSATTAGNGTYTIAGGTGPYRIEFILPTGYYASNGLLSNTTTQFIAAGGTANLGVNAPNDYCEQNPFIAVPRYVAGNAVGDALLLFPYSYLADKDGNINTATTSFPSRGASLNPTMLQSADNIGAVYGTAWNRREGVIYNGAFIKRKTKLGLLGSENPGAIYTTNASTGTTMLLTTIAAGVNPHPISSTNFNDDGNTVGDVYKVGLGDLELSNDYNFLYAVNLFDRKLYKISTADPTMKSSFSIPINGIPTASGGTCPTDDVRPFGLGRDNAGNIYVGGVCSAQSDQDQNNLTMYVWKFDGANFTMIVNESLNYERDNRQWLPWEDLTESQQSKFARRPMPQVSDIEFDVDGSMILGFIDRFGDITPRANVTPNADPYPRTGGEILRLCKSGGNFVLENAASCGGTTTLGISPTGEALPFGPGGKEFYYEDTPGDQGMEAAQGGLLLIPGKNEVVTTAYDAVTYLGNGTRPEDNINTGGLQKYSNTSGRQVGAYDVYLNDDVETFGKTHGLGDIEALCGMAPIEIGNRVWMDTDRDGAQDPNEMGLDGILVKLYQGPTLKATKTTADGGLYYFHSSDGLLPNTTYTLRIEGLDFPPQKSLTLTDQTTGGEQDLADNDASLVNGNADITYTTGNAGENNHTLDFGFSANPSCTTTPPVLTVNDNVCPSRTGSINLVQACDAGSFLQYSTNNGMSWTSAKPLYSTLSKTILARCVNTADTSCKSAVASVKTDPKKCNGGGSECTLIAAAIVDACQDNGTGDVAADDYFTIQINASASSAGVSKKYEVVLGADLSSGLGGNVLNSGGTAYGSPVTVGQNKQFKADGVSSYVLIVRDIDNKSCFQQVNITPLAPCSGLPPKSPCYPVPCVPIGGSKN